MVDVDITIMDTTEEVEKAIMVEEVEEGSKITIKVTTVLLQTEVIFNRRMDTIMVNMMAGIELPRDPTVKLMHVAMEAEEVLEATGPVTTVEVSGI